MIIVVGGGGGGVNIAKCSFLLNFSQKKKQKTKKKTFFLLLSSFSPSPNFPPTVGEGEREGVIFIEREGEGGKRREEPKPHNFTYEKELVM